MSRFFDNYIMVDWSASSKRNTGSDSIWIGVLRRDVRLQLRFESYNPPTRLLAYQQIHELLASFNKRGDKTLIGFDFCLGFPHGTAAALKLQGAPWQAMHAYLSKEIHDKPDNDNNRFQVAGNINFKISGGPFPFWSCPPKFVQKNLQPKKTIAHVEGGLPEHRLTEIAAKTASSIWKLYAPGSVGSQSLMGIPYVAKILVGFENAKIWPFQYDFAKTPEENFDNTNIVIVEIYPSLQKAKPANGETKDLAQVRAIAEHFAKLDENRKLGACFAIDKTRSSEELEIIQSEEGWILSLT
ncbi:MAG: molybdopterin-guanine dinucleotide biosynthesis protein A [Hyphomonadaceae bacterium]|nr:MAG: molybdopterin-guanine dinucleotide biosynthesis protein A [Hyphomonadaceae bacterium]